MKNVSENNKLAIKMLIAMVSGILVGLLFMAAREYFGADNGVWAWINKVLFQDITAAGAESAVGLFYIGGQLFIRALQLIIVPMVFCSVVMAISEISEASTLGRISAKTYRLVYDDQLHCSCRGRRHCHVLLQGRPVQCPY